MAWFGSKSLEIPPPERALPGRDTAMPVPEQHHVNGRRLTPPWPAGMQEIQLGLGCFWGAERVFWKLPGVYVTAVGYGGGHTPNPTYEEVCSGLTGHTELVRVVYDPERIGTEAILAAFFEGHDPTQGMRQGNDVGTQYRSAIYATTAEQLAVAQRMAAGYAHRLAGAGYGAPTTEVRSAGPFYYAEDYHQQYLSKNPGGYCGLGGTGVPCPREMA
jgi:peptide-methionine (S)-S-oxide reductase